MSKIADPDEATRKGIRWPKWMRRIARAKGGMSAVEFGLIALPLFAIILAALQAAIVLMAEQELETAADNAGRLVMTGEASSMTQANFNKQVCSYLVALFNCSNLMVNMQVASAFSSANTTAPSYTALQKNQWSYQTGSHSQQPDVVILQVMYEWPTFGNIFGFNLSTLPNGTRLLMATSVFKNEPSGS